MGRKYYETEEDLKRERNVADFIESKWDCKCMKLSFKDKLDFAIVRQGKIKAWIEIKCRNIKKQLEGDLGYPYEKYMISMSKINAGIRLSKETDKPFYLIVKFDNGIFYYEPKKEDLDLEWGGRIQTQRDEGDLEPVYKICNRNFKEI